MGQHQVFPDGQFTCVGGSSELRRIVPSGPENLSRLLRILGVTPTTPMNAGVPDITQKTLALTEPPDHEPPEFHGNRQGGRREKGIEMDADAKRCAVCGEVWFFEMVWDGGCPDCDGSLAEVREANRQRKGK